MINGHILRQTAAARLFRAIAGHTRAFERYVSPDVCCREPAHLIYVPGRWPFYEDSNAAFYPGPGFCF